MSIWVRNAKHYFPNRQAGFSRPGLLFHHYQSIFFMKSLIPFRFTLRNISAWVLLLGLAAWLPSCQGEEPVGNPDNCYFVFQTTILPGQDDACLSGGTLGYDLLFIDDAGEQFEFNNLVVLNQGGYMLNLPAGRNYRAYVLNNGNQSGSCESVDFDAYIINPQPVDTCARFRLNVNARPEAILFDSPDAEFSIPKACKGCRSFQPSCKSSADCEDSNDNIDGACDAPQFEVVNGELDEMGDVDWYRVLVPAGHNCINVAFSPPSGINYRVELYQGTQLVAGPVATGLTYCSAPGSPLVAYYIKVYGLENEFAPGRCYSIQADTYNGYW